MTSKYIFRSFSPTPVTQALVVRRLALHRWRVSALSRGKFLKRSLFGAFLAVCLFVTSLALISGAQAQSGSSAQIWARRSTSGNVEFGLRVDGRDVPLGNRYLVYPSVSTDVWYYSEARLVGASGSRAAVEVRAKKLPSGNVEFGLRVGGRREWVPQSRYFLYAGAAGDTSERLSSPFPLAGQGYSYSSDRDQDCLDGIVVPATTIHNGVDLGFNLGLARDCETLLIWRASLRYYSRSYLGTWGSGRSILNDAWLGAWSRSDQASGFRRVDRLELILDSNTSAAVGSLSPMLANLEQLDHFVIRDTTPHANISGSIPAALGSLRLKKFELIRLDLTGSIPDSVVGISSLEHFRISNSGITGSVPSFSNSRDLTFLQLDGNELSGSIPAALGTFTNNVAGISENRRRLTTVNLQNNQLTGSIPGSLAIRAADAVPGTGNPGTRGLQNIRVYGNDLSGPIPAEFANFPGLKVAEFRKAATGDNAGLTCKPAGLSIGGTGMTALTTLEVVGLSDCPSS